LEYESAVNVGFLFFGFVSMAQLNQTDAKGRKQGEWAKTYPKSRVYQYKGQFKDDKPIGTLPIITNQEK
jgi:hypothetical protein